MKKVIIFFVLILVLIVLISFWMYSYKNSNRNDMNNKKVSKSIVHPPSMEIKKDIKYFAGIETSLGNIKIDLFSKETPITVNNFVYLSKSGFYKNTIFHRVIDGFMIQGGDPNGNGTGGPGYKFDDEPFNGEYKRGIVAMANSGPNTNGSQFFIMHKDFDLPKKYVIFGKVIEGIDVVDKIASFPVLESLSGEMSLPASKILIYGIKILEEN